MLTASVESGKSRPPALCTLISPGSLAATAPAISGAESKNENRVAASRVKFRNSPAVMVIPERDTPGHNATACATPIPIASPKFDCSSLRACVALESAHHISRATRIIDTPMMAGVRRCSSICLSNSLPRMAPSKSADQQRQPILEKIKNHRQQSPRVQRHIKGFAWVWPMQQPWKKNEVRGAADRQKLRESLHQRENNSLEERHAG